MDRIFNSGGKRNERRCHMLWTYLIRDMRGLSGNVRRVSRVEKCHLIAQNCIRSSSDYFHIHTPWVALKSNLHKDQQCLSLP